MTFKVTHISPEGVKRCSDVTAASNALAMAWMEQLYGLALGGAAILKCGAA